MALEHFAVIVRWCSFGICFGPTGNLTAKHTCGEELRDQVDGSLDAEAEAEAAASAVAVAAISSDESVGSTHHGELSSFLLQKHLFSDSK